jgi:DNA-binding protein HU-beta
MCCARRQKGDDAMPDRIDKPDVVRLVAQRTGREHAFVEEVLDAALEEIYVAFKRGESVSFRNFGSFYIRPGPERWVFRFNPAQRLRKLFGWSSTYRGDI